MTLLIIWKRWESTFSAAADRGMCKRHAVTQPSAMEIYYDVGVKRLIPRISPHLVLTNPWYHTVTR